MRVEHPKYGMEHELMQVSLGKVSRYVRSERMISIFRQILLRSGDRKRWIVQSWMEYGKGSSRSGFVALYLQELPPLHSIY